MSDLKPHELLIARKANAAPKILHRSNETLPSFTDGGLSYNVNTNNDPSNPVYTNLQAKLLTALDVGGITGMWLTLQQHAANELISSPSNTSWASIVRDKKDGTRIVWKYLHQHNADFWRALIKRCAGGYINIPFFQPIGGFLNADDIEAVTDDIADYLAPGNAARNRRARVLEIVFTPDGADSAAVLSDPNWRRYVRNEASRRNTRIMIQVWRARYMSAHNNSRISPVHAPSEVGWGTSVFIRIKAQRAARNNSNLQMSLFRAVCSERHIPSGLLSIQVTFCGVQDQANCDLAEILPTVMSGSMVEDGGYNGTLPGVRINWSKIAEASTATFVASKERAIALGMTDNARREVIGLNKQFIAAKELTKPQGKGWVLHKVQDEEKLLLAAQHRLRDMKLVVEQARNKYDKVFDLVADRQKSREENFEQASEKQRNELDDIVNRAEQDYTQVTSFEAIEEQVVNQSSARADRAFQEFLNEEPPELEAFDDDTQVSTLATQLDYIGEQRVISTTPEPPSPSARKPHSLKGRRGGISQNIVADLAVEADKSELRLKNFMEQLGFGATLKTNQQTRQLLEEIEKTPEKERYGAYMDAVDAAFTELGEMLGEQVAANSSEDAANFADDEQSSNRTEETEETDG